MATQSVTGTTWTSVTTTTTDTLFQNHSAGSFYLTTEDTTGLPDGDGIRLGPNEGVTISAGKDVSVQAIAGTVVVFYMEV